MSFWTVPATPSVPDQTITATFDGVTYSLRLHWNTRAGAWFFDVQDAEDVPLLSGAKLTLGLPLLRGRGLSALPPGELLLVDTSSTSVDPGLDDLGSRVQLLYADAAELAP